MGSLYAVVLKLRSEQDVVISPTQGHHAYALFLDLIRQSGADLANRLHDAADSKPFTVSSLDGRFQNVGKSRKVVEGADYSLRFTFLEADAFSYFMDAVLRSARRPLCLGEAVFQVDRLLLDPQESSLCDHKTYQQLLDESAHRRNIGLRFVSPTTFRSGGRRNVLFPDSALVFGSFLRRWQAFSSRDLAATVSEFVKGVTVTRYRLSTRILDFDSYQETGFEGQCFYQVPDGADRDAVQAINALADFAFYCGTGAKTTMGMGQTRRST